jgi:hypothetical protein
MKKLIFSLAIAVGIINTLSATIRTVSNNASSPGQYSDLTVAIVASAVGDTLYVQGSPTTYGSITISKKLTLIGSGYSPDSTDYNLASWIDQVIFDSASYVIQGTKIIGFYISSNSSAINFASGDRGKIHNITFERCYIYNYSTPYISGNNWTFLNCILNYTSNYSFDIGNYDNLIFRIVFLFLSIYITPIKAQ